MHPNPLIQRSFEAVLNGRTHDRLVLMEPIHDYFEMLGYVKNSGTILTDSGGLQEESLFFNVPCGVLRKTTERPEVLKKNAKLLPFVAEEISDFLTEAAHYREKHNQIQLHIRVCDSATLSTSCENTSIETNFSI
jgi:UDP-N-acetylglucosamine 2-epimerase (non-hydrolysing)